MYGNPTYARLNREQELREENSFLRKQAQQARRDGALAAYDTVLAWLGDFAPASTEGQKAVNQTKEYLRKLRTDVAATI